MITLNVGLQHSHEFDFHSRDQTHAKVPINMKIINKKR